MSALVATRRKPKFGHYCDLCRANRETVRRPRNFDLTILGRPLMSVCRKCEQEAREIWEEAL